LDILLIGILIAVLVIGGVVAYLFYKPKKQQRSDSLYTDALNAMIKGDKNTALKLLRDVVKQDSDHIDAYLQLGNILREDSPQQAIKIHQSLTVRPKLSDSLKIDIYQALALDYMRVNNLKRAKREAGQILKIQRRNRWATEFLLQIAEQERDWVQAAQLAKMLQRIQNKQDPEQLAKFQVFEGLDKLASGDTSGARACFVKATKICPDYGLPYLHLGDLYEADRNLVKAIENWEKFALLTPEESSKVYTKIESALFDLGRFSEVEKFYRRLLEKDASNLYALAKLANVLEEKGERQAALSLVEEALARDDSSLHARLMKLKLSLNLATPHELARQIDTMIEFLNRRNPEE